MSIIMLGEGGRSEPGLTIHTRKKWPIPNNLVKERPLVSQAEAVRIMREICPQAEFRSITATYNCAGMVFASRRAHVDPDHIRRILNDDGYKQINEKSATCGDVVLYSRDGSGIDHVGVIAHVLGDGTTGIRKTLVLSKFGDDGEYLHPLKHVPLAYGNPTEFWSERRLIA